MRICKLTEQNIYATNVQSVTSMFRYVLPCENYCLRITKDNFRSLAAKKEHDQDDQTLVFSFKNKVFAIAKLEKKIIDKNDQLVGIQLQPSSVVTFYHAYDLQELELYLRTNQINVNFVKTSQWNVVNGHAEQLLARYLKNRFWNYG